MNVMENGEIRNRLGRAFPKAYINRQFEFIALPSRNTYFLLDGVDTELKLKCKVLEWLSREAAKGISPISRRYHLDGINSFLGTSFTQEDMMEIYTYLGNACNHEKTLRFIESGYDMAALTKAEKPV
ncbi:hypothetical protein [uncultured Dysosmobacter sp.]|uniref:hypothetical protein n=1 Tax=uncultured Dysosmobacter sp. TaxID=2591384 RepID=UPI00261FDB5D|nr:hypothetical protein [uncultured Dysosmobacter sp.]